MTRTPLFLALTRPAMFWGLPLSYFMGVFMIASLSVVLSKHPGLMLLTGGISYGALRIVAQIEPRFLDLLAGTLARTPPTRTARLWKGHAYAP